ncbi:MAG: hypothetical protein GXO78_13905 [Calditrichaeota bacterium]|nr:hypothetical protein [Calditrichota bacterium]
MSVLIIGGGIGGLTTALALQRLGIPYQLFEAAPEIKPVGAGLWLPPNAMQIFQRLEIAEAIQQHAVLYRSLELRDFTGNLLKRLDVQRMIQKFGFGTYGIHRATLHQLLLQQLDDACVHTGKRLTALHIHPDEIHAEFADGSQARGEVLIAADGLRSTVRSLLFGETPLRYSGQTCWRGTIPYSSPDIPPDGTFEIWGPEAGLRAGLGYVDGGRVYFYLTLKQKPGKQLEAERLKPYLLKKYQLFPPFVQQLLEATEPEQLIHTDLYDFPPLNRWCSGRVALLGDAAHATTPNLGQGAAQAIESAYVLAHCLKQFPDHTAAFQTYEKMRRPKATLVNKLSWHYNQLVNFISPRNRGVVFNLIRLTPAFLDHLQLDRIYSVGYLSALENTVS